MLPTTIRGLVGVAATRIRDREPVSVLVARYSTWHRVLRPLQSCSLHFWRRGDRTWLSWLIELAGEHRVTLLRKER